MLSPTWDLASRNCASYMAEWHPTPLSMYPHLEFFKVSGKVEKRQGACHRQKKGMETLTLTPKGLMVFFGVLIRVL